MIHLELNFVYDMRLRVEVNFFSLMDTKLIHTPFVCVCVCGKQTPLSLIEF